MCVCVFVCNYWLMNSKVIFCTWHIGFREFYYDNIFSIAWACKGFGDIFNTSVIMKTSFITDSGSPREHYKTLEMEIIFFMHYYMHKSKFMLSKLFKEMIFSRKKENFERKF